MERSFLKAVALRCVSGNAGWACGKPPRWTHSQSPGRQHDDTARFFEGVFMDRRRCLGGFAGRLCHTGERPDFPAEYRVYHGGRPRAVGLGTGRSSRRPHAQSRSSAGARRASGELFHHVSRVQPGAREHAQQPVSHGIGHSGLSGRQHGSQHRPASLPANMAEVAGRGWL